MMAEANLYRQRQDTVHALSAFAQASSVAGQEDLATAQTAQFELASEEGRQITQNVSLSPEALFAPALEDINVYTLDAKILHVTDPVTAAAAASFLPESRRISLSYSYWQFAGDLRLCRGKPDGWPASFPQRQRCSGSQYLRHFNQWRNHADSSFRLEPDRLQRRTAIYDSARHRSRRCT